MRCYQLVVSPSGPVGSKRREKYLAADAAADDITGE
jgi:hypothetical protein